MRVLAIGGNGFIGWHLVRALRAGGHAVTVMGRHAQPVRPLAEGVGYVAGDLGDRARLAQVLDGIDAVAHLASTTVPSTGDRDPAADVSQNLLGTLSLLQAMDLAGVRRLLFLSSGGTVYGPPLTIPVPEAHPLAPTCSYGIVKAAIERYLDFYARKTGLRPVAIRASNPYGPFQGHVGVQGIIGTFLQRIREGRPLEIWGDGSVVRDYVYVTDLARLCVAALESDRIGVYNGGSGTGTSVREVAALVLAATGASTEIIHRPGRGLDVPVSVLDATRARADLGWTAETDLAEGIGRTWRQMA
jgi:UDP-glucose 4-epimerase